MTASTYSFEINPIDYLKGDVSLANSDCFSTISLILLAILNPFPEKIRFYDIPAKLKAEIMPYLELFKKMEAIIVWDSVASPISSSSVASPLDSQRKILNITGGVILEGLQIKCDSIPNCNQILSLLYCGALFCNYDTRFLNIPSLDDQTTCDHPKLIQIIYEMGGILTHNLKTILISGPQHIQGISISKESTYHEAISLLILTLYARSSSKIAIGSQYISKFESYLSIVTKLGAKVLKLP